MAVNYRKRLVHSTRGLLLRNPEIPKNPSQNSACSAPRNDRNWRDALLKDANEAADEEGDGTDVLNYNRRIRHKRPEIVRLQPRITLEVGQKCWWIGIIVRICGLHQI